MKSQSRKHPNMTPIGTIVSQKPTGTRTTRHMLLTSCIKEVGSGHDYQMGNLTNQSTRVTENHYRHDMTGIR